MHSCFSILILKGILKNNTVINDKETFQLNKNHRLDLDGNYPYF